ncbi:uncharacterized protein LOC121386842 [Gigantopelta aegis]|uniref:uncharacterized protein LOC121386842 n=1 Tax=Gigantopelta aegis TaxID=1735272 RepID=UPI001B88D71C|nr:uncharacterized protein LOC121386842 [Gigantopelta aegis]
MYPPPPLESQPRLKTRPVFKDLRQFMRRPGRPKKTTASTSDGELPTPTTIEEEHNFSPDVSSDFTDYSSGYQGSGAKFSSQEMKEVEEINAVNAVEEMTGVNHVSDVNAAEDINFMRDMNDIYAVVKRKRKNPNRYRCTDGNFHDSTTVHESEESENEQSDDVRTSVL